MSMSTRLLMLAALSLTSSHDALAAKKQAQNLQVTATAYNSFSTQTDETPDIAAWGDRLEPGMQAIAVSRDLLMQYGLSRGQLVKISGLPGQYKVLDKMHHRWKRKIDIYMGDNLNQAKVWGKKNVTISWQ